MAARAPFWPGITLAVCAVSGCVVPDARFTGLKECRRLP